MKLFGIYWPSANFNLYVKCLLQVLHSTQVCSTWFLEFQYFRSEGRRFNDLTNLFISRRNFIPLRLCEWSSPKHRACALSGGDRSGTAVSNNNGLCSSPHSLRERQFKVPNIRRTWTSIQNRNWSLCTDPHLESCTVIFSLCFSIGFWDAKIGGSAPWWGG